MASDGSPYLALHDENARLRAALRVFPDGQSGLAFVGKNGKPRIGLMLSSDDLPALVLTDENGEDRAVLGHTALEATRTGTVEQRPASSLVLFDKDGKMLWSAP